MISGAEHEVGAVGRREQVRRFFRQMLPVGVDRHDASEAPCEQNRERRAQRRALSAILREDVDLGAAALAAVPVPSLEPSSTTSTSST